MRSPRALANSARGGDLKIVKSSSKSNGFRLIGQWAFRQAIVERGGLELSHYFAKWGLQAIILRGIEAGDNSVMRFLEVLWCLSNKMQVHPHQKTSLFAK